jgi:hypothetical protein
MANATGLFSQIIGGGMPLQLASLAISDGRQNASPLLTPQLPHRHCCLPTREHVDVDV